MNTTNLLRQRELALAVCVSLGLTACGGGGGSTPSYNIPKTVAPQTPVAPSGTPPPVDIQLTATGANVAHAAGLTGAGVTVGVIDSGVTAASPTLTGRVTARLSYVDPRANNLSVDDVVGHGTVVAEMIAGRPVGSFAGGIAPDAKIVSARIISDKTPTDDGSGKGNKVTSADPLGQVNTDVFNAGARIVNNSFGGIYWDATDTATTQSFANAYAHAIVGDSLYVFAAGNDGAANPSDIAALPNRVPTLEKGWLAVVALDSNNITQLASYSDRCGIAKNYCLAAPGSIVALDPAATSAAGAGTVWGSGTSFAAPQVAGAAAVISGEFPTFSPDAVRQILLGTADDLGDPGIDDVYGNGRLNLGRAMLGPGRLDFGNLTTDIGASNITFANDMSGNGSLTVAGSGKLTLSGKTAFAGLATTGTVTVEAMNDLPTSVGVQAGTRLIAHGDFVTPPVATAGIGGTPNIVGTLQLTDHPTHVASNMTLANGGTLSVLLGAPLTVDGTLYLQGKLNIAGAVPSYTVTSHQTIVTAKSISGGFSSTTYGQGVFLASTLQYTPTEAWMDTRTLRVSTVVANSQALSNSAAATTSAARLDGAFTQIDSALANPSAAATPGVNTLVAAGQIQRSGDESVAKRSLESLSGQLYAAGTAVTLAGIDASNDALISHLDQQGSGAWTQSLDSRGGMSRGGFGNVGFNLNGGLVGNDIRIGLNGFAGVAVAQMSSHGQLNGSFDRQRSRSTAGMFYAGSRGANWYGVGQFGFGSFRGDMRRLLRFGDQAAFAGSDQNGSYNSAYGEVGFRSHAGAFTLTPFANVEYASIRRDGFSETGGDGFGLTADGHTTSRWQAGFGLRAGSSWLTTRGTVHLDAKLGWQNAFATKGEVFAARYTGFAQWAPVDGIGLSRRAGTAGMSLGWDMTASTQLGFNVDQRFADRDHSRSANASFRMNW